MSRTNKHQDQYDVLNHREVPIDRKRKILHYFKRLNFWDCDLKIMYRQHKDYVRGGVARIKAKKYK